MGVVTLTPTLECIALVLMFIGFGIACYTMGRIDGRREMEQYVKEALELYDEFRDGVFEELGIELEGRGGVGTDRVLRP